MSGVAPTGGPSTGVFGGIQRTPSSVQNASDALRTPQRRRHRESSQSSRQLLDPERVQRLCDWIRETLHDHTISSFQQALISGRRLCLLMQSLLPNSPDSRRLSRRDGLSLSRYLRSCRRLGITDLFEPDDLIQGSGMDRVLRNLEALKRIADLRDAYLAFASTLNLPPRTPVRPGRSAPEEAGFTTPDVDEFRRRRQTVAASSEMFSSSAKRQPGGGSRRTSTPASTLKSAARAAAASQAPHDSTDGSAFKKSFFRWKGPHAHASIPPSPASLASTAMGNEGPEGRDLDDSFGYGSGEEFGTPVRTPLRALHHPRSPFIPPPEVLSAATHGKDPWSHTTRATGSRPQQRPLASRATDAAPTHSIAGYPHYDPSVVPTFLEYAALYSGRLKGVGPYGRAWLWRYLLDHEAEKVSRHVTSVRRRLLRGLVRAGVPETLRGQVWFRCSDAVTRMLGSPPGYYQSLHEIHALHTVTPDEGSRVVGVGGGLAGFAVTPVHQAPSSRLRASLAAEGLPMPDDARPSHAPRSPTVHVSDIASNVSRALAQIEVDLRRTMPNLPPLPTFPSELSNAAQSMMVTGVPASMSASVGTNRTTAQPAAWPYCCIYIHPKPTTADSEGDLSRSGKRSDSPSSPIPPDGIHKQPHAHGLSPASSMCGSPDSTVVNSSVSSEVAARLATTTIDASGCVYVSEDAIRRVLQAFAWHCPAVGYCQGLNFVVAHLLRWLGEEEAFWVLVQVVETLQPPQYYSSMAGVMADQALLLDLLHQSMPALPTHFERVGGIGVEPALVALRWFLCLFTNPFPHTFAARVWDAFLFEGPKVLFRTTIALFRACLPNILGLRTFPEAMALLEGIHQRVDSWDMMDLLFGGSLSPCLWVPDWDDSTALEGGSIATHASSASSAMKDTHKTTVATSPAATIAVATVRTHAKPRRGGRESTSESASGIHISGVSIPHGPRRAGCHTASGTERRDRTVVSRRPEGSKQAFEAPTASGFDASATPSRGQSRPSTAGEAFAPASPPAPPSRRDLRRKSRALSSLSNLSLSSIEDDDKYAGMEPHQLAAALASALDSDVEASGAGVSASALAASEIPPSSRLASSGCPVTADTLSSAVDLRHEGPPLSVWPSSPLPGSIGRSASFAAFGSASFLDDFVGEECMLASPHIPTVQLLARVNPTAGDAASSVRARSHSLYPLGASRSPSAEPSADGMDARKRHLNGTPPRPGPRPLLFPGTHRSSVSSRADSLVSVDTSTASCRADSLCSEVSESPACSGQLDRLGRLERDDSLVSVDSCRRGTLSPTHGTRTGPQPFRTPRLRPVAAASTAAVSSSQTRRASHARVAGSASTVSTHGNAHSHAYAAAHPHTLTHAHGDAHAQVHGKGDGPSAGRTSNDAVLGPGERNGLVWSERLHVAKGLVNTQRTRYLAKAMRAGEGKITLPELRESVDLPQGSETRPIWSMYYTDPHGNLRVPPFVLSEAHFPAASRRRRKLAAPVNVIAGYSNNPHVPEMSGGTLGGCHLTDDKVDGCGPVDPEHLALCRCSDHLAGEDLHLREDATAFAWEPLRGPHAGDLPAHPSDTAVLAGMDLPGDGSVHPRYPGRTCHAVLMPGRLPAPQAAQGPMVMEDYFQQDGTRISRPHPLCPAGAFPNILLRGCLNDRTLPSKGARSSRAIRRLSLRRHRARNKGSVDSHAAGAAPHFTGNHQKAPVRLRDDTGEFSSQSPRSDHEPMSDSKSMPVRASVGTPPGTVSPARGPSSPGRTHQVSRHGLVSGSPLALAPSATVLTPSPLACADSSGPASDAATPTLSSPIVASSCQRSPIHAGTVKSRCSNPLALEPPPLPTAAQPKGAAIGGHVRVVAGPLAALEGVPHSFMDP